MPEPILNKRVLRVLRKNKQELDKLIESNKLYQLELEKLEKRKLEFLKIMNEVYGHGQWADVDALAETFRPEKEFKSDYYTIKNPDLKTLPKKIDDAQVITSSLPEEKQKQCH